MTFPVFSAGTSAYNLTNSLRFRSSASAYLNKTIGAGGTNTKHVTSFWMKRGAISTAAYTVIYGAQIDANNFIYIWIPSTDKISIYWVSGGVVVLDMRSTLVLRDPSSWYHIYFAQDTTQATAANRFKIWLNGVEITSWSTNINSTTQNFGTPFGGNNVHNIGRDPTTSSNYFDGYIAEFNDIWQPSTIPPVTDFGSTNPVTGVWQPAKYTGTYGTNGFYLPFTDTTSTSTLGNDFSGNGNNWTTNNISLTPGATYDAMTDVPTLTSATAANYCVLNPLSTASVFSITNGNLTASSSTSTGTQPASFFLTSGKWYWESIGNAYAGAVCGLSGARFTGSISTAGSNGIGYWEGGLVYWDGGNSGAGPASYTSSDVIGVALNMDAGTVAFYKNNSLQFTATFGSGTVPNLSSGCFPCYNQGQSGSTKTANFNFGQRPFAYTPPSGFVALNTFNLPSSTILDGGKYFNAVTWTGANTSASGSVTGVGFQPDFVWSKARNIGYLHQLYDANRGANLALASSSTAAEVNQDASGYLTSFNSDGFSSAVGSGGGNYYFNETSRPYVAWNWKANGAGVTNTAGSITSTVSANTTSGFSVVTYTGTGSAATVGHGLGVAPSMVITKKRSSTSAWGVYHSSLGATKYLLLNTFDAAATSSTYWNNTAPTSSVFSIGTADPVNISTATYVSYCFAPIAGFSAVGSYTGNGSADGPFVYTGFRPRFVLIKADDIFNWRIFDTSRDISNVEEKELYPSLSNAEATQVTLDGLSNGFKIRTTGVGINTNAVAYLYVAFAENPFKNALAR